MKKGILQFLAIIAVVAFLLICLRILVYFFGKYYVDAVAALIILTNIYYIIKNGIKKSDFRKKNFKTMDVTIGGVSLVQAIFVFIMWIGYNATRG